MNLFIGLAVMYLYETEMQKRLKKMRKIKENTLKI